MGTRSTQRLNSGFRLELYVSARALFGRSIGLVTCVLSGDRLGTRFRGTFDFT